MYWLVDDKFRRAFKFWVAQGMVVIDVRRLH